MDELIEVPTFVCEICGMKTPITCEGNYPNVCEDCCPLVEKETDEALFSRIRHAIGE